MSSIPPYIRSLKPYQRGKPFSQIKQETGADKIIKLDSNENPIGTSPKALRNMEQAMQETSRYPDYGFALVEALAKKFSVTPANILLGSGSDSLMLNIVRVFVTEGGEVVTSEGSFPQYYLMPQSRGAVVKTAPMKNYKYDLSAIRKKITPQTQLVFLANPNNPTGTFFTSSEWEDFYQNVPSQTIIVLDEAYAEFALDNPDWPDSLHYRYDNVITLRTFSKAYGLAGVRLGYAIGAEPLLSELNKVKLPFEPSGLAIAAGLGALEDEEFLQKTLEMVRTEREFVTKRLQTMGVKIIPSAANFVMIDFDDEKQATKIHDGLSRKGIIIRPLKPAGFENGFRITLGLPEENRACLDTIETLL